MKNNLTLACCTLVALLAAMSSCSAQGKQSRGLLPASTKPEDFFVAAYRGSNLIVHKARFDGCEYFIVSGSAIAIIHKANCDNHAKDSERSISK